MFHWEKKETESGRKVHKRDAGKYDGENARGRVRWVGNTYLTLKAASQNHKNIETAMIT